MLKIRFNFPPLSQNHMNGFSRKTNRTFKTSEAKEYKRMIHFDLDQNKKEINKFLENFDKEKFGLTLQYQFFLNENKILTNEKNGHRRLNFISGDVFNFEKWTTDCIFDYLELNDALIIKGSVEKSPVISESYFVMKLSKNILSRTTGFREFLSNS